MTSATVCDRGKKLMPGGKLVSKPKFVASVTLGIAILFGAVACASAATTSSSSPASSSPAKVSSSAAPSSADDLGANATQLDSRPQPTEAQVRQIGLRLAAIQPEMAEIKVSRIESWSDSMCGDIWVAAPDVNLAKRAVARFAGGDRPPLTEEQGEQIVTAITEIYCQP